MNKTITENPITIVKSTLEIKYPVIELKSKGKLIISEYVQKRINMLHAQIGGIEWCAFITYDKLEGNINDPSTFVAKVNDIYPMNIGSETYTESDNHSSELSKMDERIPSYFMSRTGFCHTHHHMKAFFSGTDLQELHNNVDKYDGDSYYLSLIVNFEKKYVAKIVKLVDIPANKIIYNETGTEYSIDFPTKKAMIMFDLDITIEENIVWNDDVMQIRINELEAQVVANKAELAARQTSYGRTITHFRDKTSGGDWKPNKQGKLEFVEDNKTSNVNYQRFLRSCLEGNAIPTKEIGQILAELIKLNANDFDSYLDDVSFYILCNAYDEFGEDRMSEGINKCKGILKSYLAASKWRNEVEYLIEVFENCAEEMAAYEISGEMAME